MPNKHDPLKDYDEIIEIKSKAAKFHEENPQFTRAQCLEIEAKKLGFKTYAAFRVNLVSGDR